MAATSSAPVALALGSNTETSHDGKVLPRRGSDASARGDPVLPSSESSGRFDQGAKAVVVKQERISPVPEGPPSPRELAPPIPMGSTVRLIGLEKSTEYNGRHAVFQSCDHEFSRGLVQLLPPGMGAGEIRRVKMTNLELAE